MGGWIVVLQGPDQFLTQVANFKRVYSVSNVPDLQTDLKSYPRNNHVLQWSWSKSRAGDVSVADSADGNTTLILDGYITGLGKFQADGRAHTAAEVLELWQQHGMDVLPELNGSFSCTFINHRDAKATVCTDRIASRSVWVAREGTTWYVGNFSAALAALQGNTPRLDPAGLWSFMLSSRHIGTRGLFYGQYNLQAGQYAELDATTSGTCEARYWRRNYFQPVSGYTPRAWGAKIAEELRGATERLSAETKAPHLFLSGGMDSRVAAAALGNRTAAVTLTSTPNNMNVNISRRVAKHVGAPHQTIQRTPYWYIDGFNAAALISGGNYNLRHAHFLIPIPQIQSSAPNAAFMLGDLLENFNKHYFKQAPDEVFPFVPEEIPSFYTKLYSYVHRDTDRLKRLFQPELVAVMEQSWQEELVRLSTEVRELSEDDRDCFDALFRWNNCSLCPTYLMLECVRVMAHERNLMFDNEMIELLLSVPADLRGSGQLHRHTLWHLDKGLTLIPNSNYWLPPVVPDGVKALARKVRPFIGHLRRGMTRRYQGGGPVIKTEGSWHMLGEWYQKDKRHRQFIEDCFFDEDCFPPDIFRQEEIKDIWQRFLADETTKKHIFEIDMLLSFGLLHRQLPTSGLAT